MVCWGSDPQTMMRLSASMLNSGFLGISPGTFQEYVVSQADYVTPIPDTIKSEDAAVWTPVLAVFSVLILVV